MGPPLRQKGPSASAGQVCATRSSKGSICWCAGCSTPVAGTGNGKVSERYNACLKDQKAIWEQARPYPHAQQFLCPGPDEKTVEEALFLFLQLTGHFFHYIDQISSAVEDSRKGQCSPRKMRKGKNGPYNLNY
ncbi:hypothetical protein DN752_12225 [Echinicola strongylocentroti]|uniref:Uncharacterized protein n=1 Tax=Echinicola strongylocentroti TaxID=1795355 RepID=A0A2Z4IJA5_9BACT|nr:hypothetical protein [Echinicola strongylocentroti]AWW30829.1 hypothetical protein DN752_12225 [Echinicola strongylocentroti]